MKLVSTTNPVKSICNEICDELSHVVLEEQTFFAFELYSLLSSLHSIFYVPTLYHVSLFYILRNAFSDISLILNHHIKLGILGNVYLIMTTYIRVCPLFAVARQRSVSVISCVKRRLYYLFNHTNENKNRNGQ